MVQQDLLHYKACPVSTCAHGDRASPDWSAWLLRGRWLEHPFSRGYLEPGQPQVQGIPRTDTCLLALTCARLARFGVCFGCVGDLCLSPAPGEDGH